MDFLKERFSSIFKNLESFPSEWPREKQQELSSLRKEYSEIFIYALLDFIEACRAVKTAVPAASYLDFITAELYDFNDFLLEQSLVKKLVSVYLSNEFKDVVDHLMQSIKRLIRNRNSLSTIFEIINERLADDNTYVRLKILGILYDFLGFSSSEANISFTLELSDQLTSYFSFFCDNLKENELAPFPPFFGISTLLECLNIFLLEEAFTPFQTFKPSTIFGIFI
jgi:hypothetical protein